MQPGDVLSLDAGIYRDGLRLHDVHGAPGRPITIAGPPEGSRAVFWARDGHHTVSLCDSSFIVLRNLELDGRHRNVDAVKAEGEGDRVCVAVHDITLENLYIHDHDHAQHSVGINTKCNAWNWVVRLTVVERVGTGMYFGGSRGDTPFVSGLIEHNLVLDSLGYNIQIKHQGRRPDVPGIPDGACATTIRHNVLSKARNAAGGRDARPNLLVGHWPLTGAGANDVYQVYGNFFYENPSGEPLFQGEGHVALYHNLFVNHQGDAIWIQPHNDRPRMVRVFRNTIVAAGIGVRVKGGERRFAQTVIGNAVFAGEVPVAGGHQAGNVTDTYQRAGEHLRNPFDGPGRLDLSPRAGRLVGPPLELSDVRRFEDWHRDFEGRVHDGRRRGAYAHHDPAWRPALTLKRPIPASPTRSASRLADRPTSLPDE